MKTRIPAIIVAALVFGMPSAAQLPAISWTCPMHPDVLEAKKGACGICGMNLEPIRLVLVYTCPVHAVIEESKPGTCRICARDLVQKTAALTFTCAGQRSVSQLEPGTCADGSAMVARYTPRAHGDHNPKHGGIFFMAPDNWHHLEGTYPAAGRFRVYVYDDFSRPLPLAQARKIRGRLVTKEAFDPKSGTTRELSSAPLVLARNGAFFEARIDKLSVPAKMVAKIAFGSDTRESRFDFTFPAYSREKSAAAPTISTELRRDRADANVAPVSALLDNLAARRSEVDSLVKSGTLGAIYAPALQAKDLALEIQAQTAGRTGVNHDAIEANVKRIVLAAYLLDNYGDLGDGEKVLDAYQSFSTSISQLGSLLPSDK